MFFGRMLQPTATIGWPGKVELYLTLQSLLELVSSSAAKMQKPYLRFIPDSSTALCSLPPISY